MAEKFYLEQKQFEQEKLIESAGIKIDPDKILVPCDKVFHQLACIDCIFFYVCQFHFAEKRSGCAGCSAV
jgi:hypothetical protein